MGKSVKVFCTDLKKHFKNIRSAAKFAKVDDWTMSRKMEVHGKFTDAQGNVYVRQTPMETKNKYDAGKTSSIDRVTKRKKKEVKAQYFPMIDELLNQKPVTKIVFGDYPKPIQKLIESHAKEMLTKGTPFSQVKEFLLEAGCKRITINLVEDDDEK